MTKQSPPLEFTARTVEEATAKGLAQLDLTPDTAHIEVIDAGSRGLFGIGARDAVVRITTKLVPLTRPTPVVAAQPAPQPAAPKPATPPPAAPQPEAAATPAPPPKAATPVEPAKPAKPALSEEVENLLHVSRETVRDLLEKMKVEARVESNYEPPQDGQRRPNINIEIYGDDLSILIGPKAETLNALEFITRLIVGKELGRSVSLTLDVEGYRARRVSALRKLARRMANQAVKTGRRQFLEPMSGSERRIVHIELRSNPKVTTESRGEGNRRKVTISPKK